MEDRIKLAEAMGWTDFIYEMGLPPGARDARPRTHGHGAPPDPFTDANDDYAVLEWMRGNNIITEWRKVDELACCTYYYQIGDYARAALKVIQSEEWP